MKLNMYFGSPKLPPKISFLPSCAAFQHHSFTLPAMSDVPKPLRAPGLPTWWGPSLPKLLPEVISGVNPPDCDA